jgi:hypothetical protein
MTNAFKITAGVLLGVGASLFAIILTVVMLHVFIIAAFTVYHLMYS